MIPQQIGWSQESKLLWYILNQLELLGRAIFGLKPKYLVYEALLSQSGTDAPVVIAELENTLGVTLTWAYGSPGVFYGLFSSTLNIPTKAIGFCYSDGADSQTYTPFIVDTDSNSQVVIRSTSDTHNQIRLFFKYYP